MLLISADDSFEMQRWSSVTSSVKATVFFLYEWDILEMETVAKNFEREEGILEKVEQQMKCESELWMQNMIPSIKDEYIPYCEEKNTLVSNEISFWAVSSVVI